MTNNPGTASIYTPPDDVSVLGVVGAGSVGSSWVTFGLARGFDVLVSDPRPDAPAGAKAFVEAAWSSMLELGLTAAAAPAFGNVRFVSSLEEMAGASVIFEAAPERMEVKLEVIRALDRSTPASTIIATSSGGMKVSDLQAECLHPGRVVLAHPLNPAHLLPLIELCGGRLTDTDAVDWLAAFFREHGKAPVVLREEVVGHLTNRLQAALLREAVSCLLDGIASADDIDTVVTKGLGARWSAIGPLMTMHLAGGAGGTAAILAHAGDAMSEWWDALSDLRLTPEVRSRLVEASAGFGAGRSIEDLIRERDARLVRLFSDPEAAAGAVADTPSGRAQA